MHIQICDAIMDIIKPSKSCTHYNAQYYLDDLKLTRISITNTAEGISQSPFPFQPYSRSVHTHTSNTDICITVRGVGALQGEVWLSDMQYILSSE